MDLCVFVDQCLRVTQTVGLGGVKNRVDITHDPVQGSSRVQLFAQRKLDDYEPIEKQYVKQCSCPHVSSHAFLV